MRVKSTYHLRNFLILSVIFHIVVITAWRVSGPLARPAGDTLVLSFVLVAEKQQTFLETDQHQKSQPPAIKAAVLTTAIKESALRASAHNIRHPDETLASEVTPEAMTPQQAIPIATEKTVTPSTNKQGAFGTSIQAYMKQALSLHFNYPLLARKKGWQGRVEIGVHIDHDGQLSNVHILKSSGYGILDRAALSSIKRVATLSEATPWLDKNGFDMIFPVDYQLIDT